MSKIATVLIGGGGTAAVAVGGTLLFKNGFGQSETLEVSLLFDSVEKFEQGGKSEKSKCVHNFFGGGFSDGDSGVSTASNGLTNAGSFFGNVTNDQNPYKSCVLVDWKRENYDGNKGKGKFTGTGTFVKGDQGFVNFNVADIIPGDTKKLKFTGVFYLLGKEGGGTPKGKVKHKKEVKDDTTPKKEIEVAQIDSYFPKKGTGITATDLKDDYGSFFKNSASGSQLENVCGNSECTSGATPELGGVELTGTGVASSTDTDNKALKDGSKDLNWGGSIYDGSSGSLNDKISAFKGTGTKKT